jgi:hydrogenase maturation protease
MTGKPSEGSQSMIKENHRKVVLIGIGNEYRSDDGIGLLIARKICEKHLSSVCIKEESGEGVALMETWQGFDNVIITDAVSSGAKPGTIFKIDASKETVPAKFFRYSTHAFSLAEAVELAKAMKTLPPELWIYGIEGANFHAGREVSHVVQESAIQVIEQVLKKINVVSR